MQKTSQSCTCVHQSSPQKAKQVCTQHTLTVAFQILHFQLASNYRPSLFLAIGLPSVTLSRCLTCCMRLWVGEVPAHLTGTSHHSVCWFSIYSVCVSSVYKVQCVWALHNLTVIVMPVFQWVPSPRALQVMTLQTLQYITKNHSDRSIGMVQLLASANVHIIYHITCSMSDKMQLIPDLDHHLPHRCTRPQDLQLQPGGTQDVLWPMTHEWW